MVRGLVDRIDDAARAQAPILPVHDRQYASLRFVFARW